MYTLLWLKVLFKDYIRGPQTTFMQVVLSSPKNKTRRRIVLINRDLCQFACNDFRKWEIDILSHMALTPDDIDNEWAPPKLLGTTSWWISEPEDGRQKFFGLVKRILKYHDTNHSAGYTTDYHTMFKEVKHISLSYPNDIDRMKIKKLLG
jgi:hypothetical protein